MQENQVGAIITAGPTDWQIVQQDAHGHGVIELSGRWVGEIAPAEALVQVRIVSQDTGVPITRDLDWTAAQTEPDGAWSAALNDIPAGGLYRLETRLNNVSTPSNEWAGRGDMRHFLGVGDLWVIAGQSNSAGFGRGPIYDPSELGIHLYRNSCAWALASHPMNESTDTAHACTREGANPGHSPYLAFARLLKQSLGHPIGLVQTALGGSALTSWNPTESGDSPLYDNMVACIRKVGGTVRGILWYQGESDADPDHATTYADRFANAVTAWRNAIGAPCLPVVTVQLNRVYAPYNEQGDICWTQVREAQRQVPNQLGGISVVPTLDLPLSDGIHISPAGNMLLGERMARAALGAVYGKPIDHLAPDIQTARKTDANTIELRFSNVSSRLECIDTVAVAFRVVDEHGVNPIVDVAYKNSSVVLNMDERIRKGSVVHGAYGMSPCTAPMDIERFIPMLGFYGVKVDDQ